MSLQSSNREVIGFDRGSVPGGRGRWNCFPHNHVQNGSRFDQTSPSNDMGNNHLRDNTGRSVKSTITFNSGEVWEWVKICLRSSHAVR